MDSTLISEKSTHTVETFILKELVKHPHADRLSIVRVEGTDYTCVVRTEDWADKLNQLVAWVPPDSIVDTKRPEFSFLEAKRGSRIRAMKIRGINSYGILVLAPNGIKPGENAATILEVRHYDPETDSKNKKSFTTFSGEVVSPPKGIVYPKYDVDAFLKYGRRFFKDNELVYVTEKIHGSSARMAFRDGIMYCGSRYEWKKEWTSPPNITKEEFIEKIGDIQKAEETYQRVVVNFKPKKSEHWILQQSIPGIRSFCEAHSSWCLYGEAYGNNKHFPYDNLQKQLLFRAFDILTVEAGIMRWLDADEFIEICDRFEIPRVPLLAKIPFNFDLLVTMAEGLSTISGANHIREGVVVKPEKDRFEPNFGRICFKIVNPKFLEIN